MSAAATSAAGRGHRGPGGRCSVCRRRKNKVHRSRRTGRLVCPACADRARMKVLPCTDCGRRKLIQARGRCYACYKRLWRSRRGRPAPLVAMAARRRYQRRESGRRAADGAAR